LCSACLCFNARGSYGNVVTSQLRLT
jgi:hypothetical protein